MEIPCVLPLARGGREVGAIPVLIGRMRGLPLGLAGLVMTSDLQAREVGPANRAIGAVVADTLANLSRKQGLNPQRVGVVLAGDLYTSATLHRRFGVGDVCDVWDAFAGHFRWVTGVLGNVDRLKKAARKRHKLLTGTTLTLDGLRIAGVSGIIGPNKMENRRPEAVFLRELARELDHEPDLLVLHEGPSIPGEKYRGSDAVRHALRSYTGTVVCGHNSWPHPLASLRSASVLNTDSRCILFRRA
ncbi:MAG: metallophosphoesterase [Nannocystaceae bacterium]